MYTSISTLYQKAYSKYSKMKSGLKTFKNFVF